MSSYFSRKFILTILGMAIITIGFFTGFLSEGAFQVMFLTLAGMYFGVNTFEGVQINKNGNGKENGEVS